MPGRMGQLLKTPKKDWDKMLKGLFNQMKSRSRTAWGVSQISACLLTAMIFAPLAAEDDKREKKLDVKQKNVKRLG